MARVDPDDDSIRRFVVFHFRYDEDRHERRNVIVAAFDNQDEFEVELRRRSSELANRRAAGRLQDPEEDISGTILEAGHAEKHRKHRLVGRAIRHGAIPPTDLLSELGSYVGRMSANDDEAPDA